MKTFWERLARVHIPTLEIRKLFKIRGTGTRITYSGGIREMLNNFIKLIGIRIRKNHRLPDELNIKSAGKYVLVMQRNTSIVQNEGHSFEIWLIEVRKPILS